MHFPSSYLEVMRTKLNKIKIGMKDITLIIESLMRSSSAISSNSE